MQSKEVGLVRDNLQTRFQKGSTVLSTKSFHFFSSNAVGSISYKRVSSDCQFTGTHNFFKTLVNVTINDIKIMSYVACIYDAKWWIGLVEEVDKCNNDILVNFLHYIAKLNTHNCIT